VSIPTSKARVESLIEQIDLISPESSAIDKNVARISNSIQPQFAGGPSRRSRWGWPARDSPDRSTPLHHTDPRERSKFQPLQPQAELRDP
jgi:hypothetical protein